MEIDRISASFKNQVVFMTGATGFMGKVFLERVLRLTEVRQVFLLIRPKRSKNSEERLLEIFDNPLFETLKARMSLATILAKVSVVAGDCSCVDLSLAPSDRSSLVDNTTMMFHFAATIKFNEKFKRAIELNVRGTREMLKLALECGPRLLLFCHISTAFCHLEQRHLLEQAYEPAADPHAMIAIAETFDEEEVEEKLASYISEQVPNTYVFTKALSEALVARARVEDELPVMIARPAIVLSTHKDPIPGWTDNLNNITGVMAALAMGVLRTGILTNETVINIVPVDSAISNVMVCVWHFVSEKKSAPLVVNLESESEKLLNFRKIGLKTARDVCPFENALWYPNSVPRTNRVVFAVEDFFVHTIPGFIVDSVLRVIGRKPILLAVHRRIARELQAVKPFMGSKWMFEQQNLQVIASRMNDVERRTYGTERVDLETFLPSVVLGIRRYVFKQSDASVARSKRRVRIMYCIDRAFKLATLIGLVYFIARIFPIGSLLRKLSAKAAQSEIISKIKNAVVTPYVAITSV